MGIIKQWLKQRRLAKRQALYNRGYSWALSAFFVEKMPLHEIEGYTDYVYFKNAFDDGANEATTVIRWFLSYVPLDKQKSLNLFSYNQNKGNEY